MGFSVLFLEIYVFDISSGYSLYFLNYWDMCGGYLKIAMKYIFRKCHFNFVGRKRAKVIIKRDGLPIH
ncbi:unnamed protein product [Meloidogyne enterolobii]|uniref:Uncharacterized protein n=1 Tax=Meloidogyne enterolobii TaxID=390850 RepID=A0ACB1AIX8_MELEN